MIQGLPHVVSVVEKAAEESATIYYIPTPEAPWKVSMRRPNCLLSTKGHARRGLSGSRVRGRSKSEWQEVNKSYVATMIHDRGTQSWTRFKLPTRLTSSDTLRKERTPSQFTEDDFRTKPLSTSWLGRVYSVNYTPVADVPYTMSVAAALWYDGYIRKSVIGMLSRIPLFAV